MKAEDDLPIDREASKDYVEALAVSVWKGDADAGPIRFLAVFAVLYLKGIMSDAGRSGFCG